jgi:hypothetical protein
MSDRQGRQQQQQEVTSVLSPNPAQVIVDTTGWAFAYPLFRLAGARVACYTHYPTISTDMLSRVMSMQATYNNDAAVAGSPLKSLMKAVYYSIFAAAYGAVGACANVRAIRLIGLPCMPANCDCLYVNASLRACCCAWCVLRTHGVGISLRGALHSFRQHVR